MAHIGVTCDGCGISNFFGNRFKCLICYDYDLCHGCASNGVVSKDHQDSHPMQQLSVPGGEWSEGLFGRQRGLGDPGGFGRGGFGMKALRRERELTFGGDAFSVIGKGGGGLQCPSCGVSGLSDGKFYDHMVEEHRGDPIQVVCPLCHVAPHTHPSYRRGSLIDHLRQRHKRVSEKLQRQRILRRIVRHAGSDASQFTELLSSMSEDEAAALLDRVESGENLTQVLNSIKSSKSKDSPPAEVHSDYSLLRPIAPTTDLDRAQQDRDRAAKAMFVQELLLSTLV